MPLWVQPQLRFLQASEESNGIIQTRNSALMTIFLAKETAGTAPPKVIPADSYNFRGTKYTPAAGGSA